MKDQGFRHIPITAIGQNPVREPRKGVGALKKQSHRVQTVSAGKFVSQPSSPSGSSQLTQMMIGNASNSNNTNSSNTLNNNSHNTQLVNNYVTIKFFKCLALQKFEYILCSSITSLLVIGHLIAP